MMKTKNWLYVSHRAINVSIGNADFYSIFGNVYNERFKKKIVLFFGKYPMGTPTLKKLFLRLSSRILLSLNSQRLIIRQTDVFKTFNHAQFFLFFLKNNYNQMFCVNID